VIDGFRGQPDVSLVDDDEIERLADPVNGSPDETQVPESERLKLLKSGLLLLSETEQTILRATMSFYQPDKRHQRMPHAAMQELSQQLAESPENIRQIRSRAMKKLEKHINDNLHNEKTG
jgi:DNA-directed RNA polymerase sigma subunit (sigma70/sigma32)